MTTVQETPQTTDARELWRCIFGEERGLLHLFTARRNGDTLTDPRPATYNYPNAAEAAAKWALDKSAEGREVYFCAHLLTGPQRRKEYAGPISALWGELDGGEVPDRDLRPSAVVESSPGKFHLYWFLTDTIPPEIAEQLNKSLASEIVGADASGFDLTQLLRVPGTVNYKYPEKPVVKIRQLTPELTYSPGELENLLPDEVSAAKTSEAIDSDDEPPIALYGPALEMWRGERPKLKEGGEVDRSATLLAIGRALYDAGANRQVVIEALAERDEALGYEKYSTNRDGGRREYQRIFAKLAQKGRSRSRPISPNGRNSHSRSLIGNVNVNEEENGSSHHPKRSLRAVSFAGRDKPPPQEFVVERIIPCGMATSFYGGGGLAKSVNVLHLGMAVSFAGLEEWHGLRIATMPTIYLDFEMAETVQLRRAKEIADGAEWPDTPKGFHYVEAAGHSTADVFAFALELLEDRGPSLVIVDSFGFSMQGESERSADVLAYVRNYIQPLQDKGGTPLVVDHIARAIKGERTADKEAFGSVYKTNSMRSTVNVTGHTDEDAGVVYATFTHRKSNVGPKQKPFTIVTRFTSETIAFERSEDVIHPPTEETIEQQIVTALREHGPMTNKQIAAVIDRDIRSVQNATSRLKGAGALAETGEKIDREAVLDVAGL
jgi:AAA domain-containing protein/DNA primase RepB-like protein